ncbi:MAG TPA: hypothetical protein PKD86_06650 [Gemmatales bacterium]|nr:hypothetical protein [Gemmatales bacterium]HMP59016.1 hypothetical protein [Gemmatales bacterium]
MIGNMGYLCLACLLWGAQEGTVPTSPTAPTGGTAPAAASAATAPAGEQEPAAVPTAPAAPVATGIGMPLGLPPRPTKPVQVERRIGALVEPALWLVGALLLGAVGIAVLKKMQRPEPTDPEAVVHAQLAAFRAAHEAGEMTTEEFKKVKEKLTPKIKEMGQKPPEPPAPKPAS